MNFHSISEAQRVPNLKSNEARIWFTCLLDNEKNILYFASILSEDECQKVNRFRFSKDQKNFIISRGILKCLLGKYLEQEPQEVEIIYGLWGKPCLVEHSLYFNLSHSRDYVLYALTWNYEVGIDLEYIDPILDLEEIVLSILSPQELAYWKTVNREDKIKTFFKFWVCKEAFLKALGKGWLNDQWTIPLKELGHLKNDDKNSERTEKMRAPYYFETIPGYASALFIEGPFLRPIYYIWNSII